MNDNEELREQQKDAEIERLTDDYAASSITKYRAKEATSPPEPCWGTSTRYV